VDSARQKPWGQSNEKRIDCKLCNKFHFKFPEKKHCQIDGKTEKLQALAQNSRQNFRK